MKNKILLGIIAFSIFAQHTIPAYAGWEQSGDEWKYVNEETLEYEKNKWIFDSGDWYYIGDDGLMYESQWLVNESGERIAWFGADGKFCGKAYSVESSGPGIEINQYLTTDYGNGARVDLNMDCFVDLSDGERALLNYILGNYKIETQSDIEGNFKQEMFIVLTAEDIASFIDVEVINNDGNNWLRKEDFEKILDNINDGVMKEVREPLFYTTNWRIKVADNLVSSVTLELNRYMISRITNLQHVHELINNTIVRKLNIVDGQTSQTEAASRIYKYICSEFDYDLDYIDADLMTCLTYRKGVCWSFATLYKKICNMCGIQCDIEGGQNYWYPGELGHVWNRNIIDGIETWTDCTIGESLKEAGSDKWLQFNQSNRINTAYSHWNYIFCK